MKLNRLSSACTLAIAALAAPAQALEIFVSFIKDSCEE